jgi:hypothetical protein
MTSIETTRINAARFARAQKGSGRRDVQVETPRQAHRERAVLTVNWRTGDGGSLMCEVHLRGEPSSDCGDVSLVASFVEGSRPGRLSIFAAEGQHFPKCGVSLRGRWRLTDFNEVTEWAINLSGSLAETELAIIDRGENTLASDRLLLLTDLPQKLGFRGGTYVLISTHLIRN